ncbi:MAG: DUF2191 domain-containing protein [Actinobacteria bacterium HGW-Actinobacteria-4]|nr:MAG: DUF2191 domain-containing protein [Actinobacteria bacterium HGW-Actinobacteria-4]
MRTTIRLNDAFYDEVKRAAQERGETFTSFVERALTDALAGRHAEMAQPGGFTVRPYRGEGGLLPGIDLLDKEQMEQLAEPHLARQDSAE